jgi:hypothetical protein
MYPKEKIDKALRVKAARTLKIFPSKLALYTNLPVRKSNVTPASDIK